MAPSALPNYGATAASAFRQLTPSSSALSLDMICDKGEGGSRSRQGSVFSDQSSSSISSCGTNLSGASGNSSSSLMNNNHGSLNGHESNFPNGLFQAKGAKVYADAYDRLKKEARRTSISQQGPTLEEEEQWCSQLRNVGVSNFEAVMMVHRLKTYLTVPYDKPPAPERRPPPLKPKQNLHNVFAKLRYLIPRQDVTNRCSEDIKGKCVDRSPQHAYGSSPLYWTAASDDDVDFLIKDHELEWETERLRTEDEKLREDYIVDEAADPNWEPRWRKQMNLENVHDKRNRVFGVPLLQMQKYASLIISIGGYQHDLPLIVYICVEQLYRTGLTFHLLFRAPPDRDRLDKLAEEFDTGPKFIPNRKEPQKLKHESVADIGALLRRYIEALPHSLMSPAVYEAFRYWCGHSSYRSINSEDDIDEARKIEIAKLLFKSMPAAHCALLSYLCAFFTQVPLSSDCNHLDIHSIAHMFAVPLLKHTADPSEKYEACLVMTWILERWGKISEGLFDVEEEPTPRLLAESSEESSGSVERNLSGSSGSSSPSLDGNFKYSSSDDYSLPDFDERMSSLEISDSDVGFPLSSSLRDDNFDKDETEDWNNYSLEKKVQNIKVRLEKLEHEHLWH